LSKKILLTTSCVAAGLHSQTLLAQVTKSWTGVLTPLRGWRGTPPINTTAMAQ